MKFNAALLLLSAFVLGLSACDVQKTQEGEMPKVDVDVKDGQVPKYDVDAADIDMKKKEVTVPTLEYDTPAEQREEERMGKD